MSRLERAFLGAAASVVLAAATMLVIKAIPASPPPMPAPPPRVGAERALRALGTSEFRALFPRPLAGDPPDTILLPVGRPQAP